MCYSAPAEIARARPKPIDDPNVVDSVPSRGIRSNSIQCRSKSVQIGPLRAKLRLKSIKLGANSANSSAKFGPHLVRVRAMLTRTPSNM